MLLGLSGDEQLSRVVGCGPLCWLGGESLVWTVDVGLLSQTLGGGLLGETESPLVGQAVGSLVTWWDIGPPWSVEQRTAWSDSGWWVVACSDGGPLCRSGGRR